MNVKLVRVENNISLEEDEEQFTSFLVFRLPNGEELRASLPPEEAVRILKSGEVVEEGPELPQTEELEDAFHLGGLPQEEELPPPTAQPVQMVEWETLPADVMPLQVKKTLQTMGVPAVMPMDKLEEQVHIAVRLIESQEQQPPPPPPEPQGTPTTHVQFGSGVQAVRRPPIRRVPQDAAGNPVVEQSTGVQDVNAVMGRGGNTDEYGVPSL